METSADTAFEVLLASLAKNGNALQRKEPHARRNLLDAARSLIAELETPVETVTRIAWAEPNLFAALRTAIDLKLFEKLIEEDAAPMNAEKLAVATGSDPALIGRLMKHFVAMKIVAEPSADTYTATKLSKALAIPKYRDGISNNFDVASLPLAKLPTFFAKNGYRNPDNAANCPFQHGHDTTQVFFEWITERPAIVESFNNHMAGYRQGRPSWMNADFYPVVTAVQNADLNDESPLLVDVGGGIGHDIEEFKTEHPNLPGRLILQDLPSTIQQAVDAGRGIEMMAHDIFTPQPIVGAKFYYLHSVLHDWSDENCRAILIHLVHAMRKDYSKILINENVVPDRNAPWLMTSLDLLTMVLGAAAERTEQRWRDLLSSVGLRIVKIWSHPEGIESLIEAELE